MASSFSGREVRAEGEQKCRRSNKPENFIHDPATSRRIRILKTSESSAPGVFRQRNFCGRSRRRRRLFFIHCRAVSQARLSDPLLRRPATKRCLERKGFSPNLTL